MGYFAYYIDTEGATEDSDFEKFGCNQEQLKIIRTIKSYAQLRFFVNTLIDMKKDPELEDVKLILFVDSYGMLNTNKEIEDAKKGKNAADMGLRAKEGRQLFRNITLDLSNLAIPMLFTNHTGASLDMFKPGDIPVGGEGPTFSASIIVMLDKGRLKAGDDKSVKADEADAQTQTGIIVKIKTHKNRLAQPIPAQTHISFAKGMNPYVYLETFIGWNECGVVRGTIYTDDEFKKKFKKGVGTNSAGKELPTYEFENKKAKYYCVASDTSKTWAVRDTRANVPLARLWTDEVFTHNTLKEMDKNVIMPRYKYKSIEEVMQDELLELAVAAEMKDGMVDEAAIFDLHAQKAETDET